MFKRWWGLLLVLMVVGPFIGFLTAVVVTYVMPKKYESGVHVALGEAIVVTPFPGTDLISIKTRLPNRDDALEISEGLIKAYEEHHNEIRKAVNEPAFKDVVRIISTQEVLVEEKKLRDLKMEFTLKGVPSPSPEQVSVHEPARLPISPVSPNVPVNLVTGLVGGLLVSPVIAILLMMLCEKLWPARRSAHP